MQKVSPQHFLFFLFFTFSLDNLLGICSENTKSYIQNCAWDRFLYANAADATAISPEKAAGTCRGLS